MSSNIRIEKTCLYCGELFIARTTVTKYCSHICSRRAYKKRQRQAKLQAVAATSTEALPEHSIHAKNFLSVQETCRLLGISRWTVYRMIARKQLKTAKLGRRIIIKKEDLDTLFIL